MNVKENGTKTQRVEKNPFWGSPALAMRFYPSRTFPKHTPFGNSTPGLIRAYPQQILVPGVLQLWETLFFSYHTLPLSFLMALSPIKSFWEDAYLWESSFLLITWLPWPPGVSSHQLFPGGCPSVANAPLSSFPFWVPTPAALQPIPYLCPLCMHLFIANISDL